MVEQWPLKPLVEGSSPSEPTKIPLTTWRYRLDGLGRRVFIPEITGSNPVGATKKKHFTL
jgi:hypothetical protein